MNSPIPKSILIVEDDAILRGAYAAVLAAEGYRTVVSDDGQEALKVAADDEFDIILLDMLMPNLNGLEFLKAYEAPRYHPQTKIIVFSNMSVPSDVKDAMRLGASKYLTKASFTPKEIASIIKELLEGV